MAADRYNASAKHSRRTTRNRRQPDIAVDKFGRSRGSRVNSETWLILQQVAVVRSQGLVALPLARLARLQPIRRLTSCRPQSYCRLRPAPMQIRCCCAGASCRLRTTLPHPARRGPALPLPRLLPRARALPLLPKPRSRFPSLWLLARRARPQPQPAAPSL